MREREKDRERERERKNERERRERKKRERGREWSYFLVCFIGSAPRIFLGIPNVASYAL